MAKTGEAYAAARSQLDQREPGGRPESAVHVTNGDSAAAGLRQAGFRGRILPWRDVLHDGPVQSGLTPAALRQVRARFLAERVGADAGHVQRDLAARDRNLAAAAGGGQYMLWFEADLYDQLQLLQVLDALSALRVDPARITLVCIGEYRGIAHFGGLGELTPEQLAGLADEAVQLRHTTIELAVDAWRAFTSPDPERLGTMSRARSPELRFLAEAFGRLMREYPSLTDGLSLTQRRVLLAVADRPASAGEIFRRVSDAEQRPFLGDAFCFACIRDLATASHPLADVEPESGPFLHRSVRLTATGRDVLAGHQDHVRLNGIDRWIGGVHLTRGATDWRFDERLERLSGHGAAPA
jgi:hypothetical protein